MHGHASAEFRSTYFALRLGLVLSAVLVLLAPLAARVFDGSWPPTISDAWYTDARTVFVLGLAAAASLLLVVRGDTLTEQTLLNVAGGLGLLVAGAACWPKDDSGEMLASFDPAVARLNVYAVGALLVLAVVARVAGLLLPAGMLGDGWHVSGAARTALRSVAPVLVAALVVVFLIDRTWLATHIHEPAAVVMFFLLGCVVLLRTTPGLRLLGRIGDTPADDTVSSSHLGEARRSDTPMTRLDVVYAAVAAGMIVVVVIAALLLVAGAAPGWILVVEALLLVLFGTFWALQTWEAWQSAHDPTPRVPA